MYDETRQHIKKHRRYFASKGPSSQSFGFSNSYVWMWELDHKESCSVQFSHSVVSDSLWPHELQHARPPCPSPTPGVYPNSCPLVGDVTQPSHPLSFPSSAFSISQYQDFFQWVRSSHQAAKVLEFQLQQYWSFSFSMSPSNEHPGLISFRMDWLDRSFNSNLLFSLFLMLYCIFRQIMVKVSLWRFKCTFYFLLCFSIWC